MRPGDAAVRIGVAIAEAIRELGEVPSGHLYARLMDRLSLAQYEAVVEALVASGCIEKRGHLLTWTGGKAAMR